MIVQSQRKVTEKVDDSKVEGELNDGVHELKRDGSLRIDKKWPHHIENGLEDDPDELAKGGAEQLGLERSWYVSVQEIITLVLQNVGKCLL